MTNRPRRGDPVGRSDSGPVGVPMRKLLGLDDTALDDTDLDDGIWDSTKIAIAAENLRDLKHEGRGGYGVVCKAKDERTGNYRAIKVVLEPQNQDRIDIFDRECRVLAAVDLPRDIAPQYFGSKKPPGAQPFLIEEWIEGRNLSDWLDAHPQLSMRDRESLCRAIFATYARLHRSNIAHRDVSLKNIMITGGKAGHRIRLIDFGSSGRAIAGYASHHTKSRIPTTEAFASDPVRNGDRKPSLADEVHAVANLCFYVLTGELAFGKTQDQRRDCMREKRVLPEIVSILLPKLENPPLRFVQETPAKEF